MGKSKKQQAKKIAKKTARKQENTRLGEERRNKPIKYVPQKDNKFLKAIQFIWRIIKKPLIIALLIVPIAIVAVNSELVVGDEIWNFQNVMKMVNGYQIYVDCNVITTPIFFIIGTGIVSLFGSNILGFRIYNIILFLALFLVVYWLFRNLKVKKLQAKLYTLFVALFMSPYISSGANYNILATMLFIMRNNCIFKQRKYKIL